MIRVGIIMYFSKEYKGGINYLKNLLYASHSEAPGYIHYTFFVPSDLDQDIIDAFLPYAQVIKTNVLKRKSMPWYIDKVSDKLFKKNLLLINLLKKYKIEIVSHSNFFSRFGKLKIVSWIPDFQLYHFPDLWSASERNWMINLNKKVVKYSDRIILSSNDSLKDYIKFASEDISKVKVMQFVSQPSSLSETEFIATQKRIQSKYQIEGDFLYLPNQFWSHKNHMVVFKAINLLKNRGLNPLLVTTGHMVDYRGNDGNIKMIRDFIEVNDLSKNILLLGLIPYAEVLVLMKTCTALINPSLFEGWSSTVEEAKSIGKKILVSDIPIHREQDPETGIYFDPRNESALADIIENVLSQVENKVSNNFLTDEEVQNNLATRTKLFAQKYHQIITELYNER
ncbi:glycosyltransferase [Mucilaginibacter endophyticus]|uniref:glycosyltransferase n=1 Tax=Mucilaginibacter endophyticus TaxID=2675003 RepID=UPI000E0CF51F|nr:glycosyltransferase [Mucilaginibacter endophyticus]